MRGIARELLEEGGEIRTPGGDNVVLCATSPPTIIAVKGRLPRPTRRRAPSQAELEGQANVEGIDVADMI